MQSTLGVYNIVNEEESDYEHLVSHLVQQADDSKPGFEWTRVFTRDESIQKRVPIYSFDQDLVFDKSLREVLRQNQVNEGEVQFSPLLFKANDIPKDLSQCHLDLNTLISLGQLATQAKSRFKDFVSPRNVQGPIHNECQLSEQEEVKYDLNRSHTRKWERSKIGNRDSSILDFSESGKRKFRKRCQLTTDELFSIVQTVKQEKYTHKQAAIKFDVSVGLVNRLVAESKKSNEFLGCSLIRERRRKDKLRAVLNESRNLLRSKSGLINTQQVVEAVRENTQIQVNRQYVGQVLREDLGVRYRRIKKVPFLGNSRRCLYLRQQYSQYMLQQLANGVRVINIDQTWVNDTMFLRRRWRQRGEVNTVADCSVRPRISVFMAIDTDGKVYCSLTQVNTDSSVFCLFLSKLSAKLQREDKKWRLNTLLLCDGAKYQTCEESVSHMKALGFRVCISAPYSYASSPIEYGFAFLKATNLNPKRLSTGKKNIADLINQRIIQLKPEIVKSLWRHIIFHLFEYIILKRL